MIRLLFMVICALLFASTLWAILRRIKLQGDKHTRRMASLWHLTGCDALAEPGISLLVDFADHRTIESLLDVDYLRYEVVVVGNVEQHSSLRKMLARYSMMDMGAPVVERHLQRSSRRLYRSRERRYRRLVVVDTLGQTLAERMNCALAVRSYDMCILLPQGVTLLNDALRVLAWRLMEVRHTSAISAPTLASKGARGYTSEMWQFLGGTQGNIVLLEGDTLASLGGFGAFDESLDNPTPHYLKELKRRGADITRVAVAVGKMPQKNVPVVWPVTMWAMIVGCCIVAILAKGEERWMAASCVVLIVMEVWIVAILARALGREAGTPRKWSEIWMTPFSLPRVTKKMR